MHCVEAAGKFIAVYVLRRILLRAVHHSQQIHFAQRYSVDDNERQSRNYQFLGTLDAAGSPAFRKLTESIAGQLDPTDHSVSGLGNVLLDVAPDGDEVSQCAECPLAGV